MTKLIRILLKGLLFLVILGGLFLFFFWKGTFSSLSLYNVIWKGRERFPFGETPRQSYNLSLSNLDAMFAAHEISAAGSKGVGKIRVVVIGDSSVWGTLLRADETLPAQLDGRTIVVNGEEKRLEVYNLGYPTLSLSKDFLILNRALAYEPDLVIWSMTFESFPEDKQLTTALVADNADEFNALAEASGIKRRAERKPVSFSRIRRDVYDFLRLQFVGYFWNATGVDQDLSLGFNAPLNDYEADASFHQVNGVYPMHLQSWDVIRAAVELAKGTKILIFNEPMFIGTGENHDIRYNYYYPRAAYDDWRKTWLESCAEQNYSCIDAWNALENGNFTNSAIHYDPIGANRLSEIIIDVLPQILSTD